MTPEDKKILDKINEYAEKVLADIDPQKTQVSFQLDKLKPIMEEIAKELNIPVEDVFIKYMDLQSEASIGREHEFLQKIGDPSKFGDVQDLGKLNF